MLDKFAPVFIFGLMSILMHHASSSKDNQIQSISILLAWACLLAFLFTIEWASPLILQYFSFCLLGMLVLRLIRYEVPEWTEPVFLYTSIFTLGLVTITAVNGEPWSCLLILGVLALQIVNQMLIVDYYSEIPEFLGVINDVGINGFMEDVDYYANKLTRYN